MNWNARTILGGLALAVAAGLIVQWLLREFGRTCAQRTAWYTQVIGRCSLPNLNQTPQSPASAYPSGAPVTNYRPVLNIGNVQVPAQ